MVNVGRDTVAQELHVIKVAGSGDFGFIAVVRGLVVGRRLCLHISR